MTALSKVRTSPDSIIESEGDMRWWDTRGPVENALTAGDIQTNAVNPTNYIRSINSVNGQVPIATTLLINGASGPYPSEQMILNSGFFAQSTATQNYSLLHEALHVVTGKLDKPLADGMGINYTASNSPGFAITPFLQGGCNTSSKY